MVLFADNPLVQIVNWRPFSVTTSVMTKIEDTRKGYPLSLLWIVWLFLTISTTALLITDFDITGTEGRVIGTVIKAHGSTEGRSGDLSLWRETATGDSVREGGWIRTGSDSGLRIQLESGAMVAISSDSQVLISLRSGSARDELILQLDRGQISIQNTTDSNEKMPISISSINGFEHVGVSNDKVSVFSNLEGKLDSFQVTLSQWLKDTLGERYVQAFQDKTLSFDKDAVDASRSVEIKEVSKMGDSLSLSALNLRVKPSDPSKIKWFLEKLNSLENETISFVIQNKNSTSELSKSRSTVLAVIVPGKNEPEELASVPSGATSISVKLGQLFKIQRELMHNSMPGTTLL